jgi:ribose transport system substrate-binding protein
MGIFSNLTRSRVRGVVIGATLVILLASCSTAKTASPNATPVASATVTSAADSLAKAKADALAAQGPVSWNGPTTVVKSKSKMNLVILDCALSLEGCSVAATNAQAAAKALGWTSKLIEVADGSTYGAKFNTALTQNPDAILTIGFEASSLPKDGLAKAKAKHIPIVDFNGGCIVGPAGCDASQVYNVAELGRLQALALINATDGKLNLITFTTNELGSGHLNNEATAAYLKANCSTCKVTDINFLLGDLGPKFQAQLVSAVKTNVGTNAILLPFDPIAGLAIPALQNAGLAKQVALVTNIGLKQNLQWVAQGNVQVADVVNALDWGTWAAIDMIVRLLNGAPLEAENVPLKLMTKSNAPANGIWNHDGVNFIAKYQALWGLNASK